MIVALALGSSACTADFFLGADTEGSTTGSPTGAESTTMSAPTSAEGSAEGSLDSSTMSSTASSTSEGTDTTTASTETSGPITGDETTTGVETTTGTPEVTTDPTAGEGGVLDCPDAPGARACDAQPACDWYVGYETCFADPCHPDAEIVCDALDFKGCSAAPLCTWFGEPEAGECGYTPCGKLTTEACAESPACEWVPEPGMCIFVECPNCYELGEVDCLGADGCAWLDLQETCVPD